MTDRIHVDFDQLDLLQKTIDIVAKGLQNVQEWFDSLVKWLRTQWSGAAEVAFEVAQRIWDGAMGELRRALTVIAKALGLVTAVYRNVEKANVDTW